MSLQGWNDLHCECGNAFFQQAYQIAWHEQNGSTTKPSGWTCTGCGKRSDHAAMIKAIKVRNMRTKITELEEQL